MSASSAENADVAAYRQAVRSFLDAEVAPKVPTWERQGSIPREVMTQLGGRGLITSCFRATDTGGASLPLDLSRYRILIEELARTRCFGLLLMITAHVGAFLPMVMRLAAPSLRERIAGPALAGEELGGLAVTESPSGSDLLGIATALEMGAETLLLNGEKTYVTNVPGADHLIVLARWRPGRHFANFAAVVATTRATGVTCEKIPLAVARGATVGRVRFERVALAPETMLGRKELGVAYFQEHVTVERLTGGVFAVTFAETCLQEARRHAIEKRIGEGTLWEQSAVRQSFARAAAQVAMLRALVDRAFARGLSHGKIDALDAALIKASVASIMEQVIGFCLQLRGAGGLEEGSPLLRAFDEFRVFGVAGGSTETMLELVADLWTGGHP